MQATGCVLRFFLHFVTSVEGNFQCSEEHLLIVDGSFQCSDEKLQEVLRDSSPVPTSPCENWGAQESSESARRNLSLTVDGIFFARVAKFKDMNVSSRLEAAGEQFTNMIAFAVPPNESCKICVNLWFRYGTIFKFCVRASITSPKAVSDLLTRLLLSRDLQ